MQFFNLDARLGIEVPDLSVAFEDLPTEDRERILVHWEAIRARIPEQIMKFEHVIEDLLKAVHHEEDWDTIAAYFSEISDYASRINELNTWRRIDPALHPVPVHHSERVREHRDREK
ncbi:hypothetical protein LLE49_13735 [Alicyclobacillus tolerans]|uniref:hypothetical protein n=1 Tax=Alicyclobacillus tolerans TaxID=90970 RepID=UPI001F1FE43A|nr:hypothetical protein [Alicyclobacillus tolerans]MCF8565780.1 hypothetical protein [Alicyclobacillus tolerans]